MRKKLSIFSIFIFFSVLAFAQIKMDKPTFERLVDYANCRYLMTFIETHDVGKPYITDTYEKKVKPVLQRATVGNLNNVPNFTTIKGLFPKGSNNAASSLMNEINNRKEKYTNELDINLLIEFLKINNWKDVNLEKVSERIKKEVGGLFSAIPIQRNANESGFEIIKEQLNQISPRLDELQERIDTLQKKYYTLQDDSQLTKIKSTVSTVRTLVVICFVLIASLLVVLFLLYKSQLNPGNHNSLARKFVKSVFFDSKEIREKIESKTENTNASVSNESISELKAKIIALENRLNELSEDVKKKNAEGAKKNVNQQSSEQTSNLPLQSNYPVEKYFSSKSNKQLIDELQNSVNASFKVNKIKGNEAEFEYVGAVRNENWFEGVCTIENLANDNLSDKKYIRTTFPGKVAKENEFWVVTTPAKIKFE